MPRSPSNSGPQKPISAHKHKDKRANIPTEELRDFVQDQEKAPKNVLYPRNPSLDPQLVWKGKDEQDAHPLEVPAVPIYIQEKIHPQALVQNLLQDARAGKQEPELALFSDFNGIQFDQLIEFYQHKDGVNWANRMILGDSLLVMNSLAEKEGLRAKVQMIYIDPPYGIKFGSNWQVSTRKRDVKDGKAEDATRQPEQIRAFRDTWKLGIHSYLAYLRDRLAVARELLTESGSVFVQIGDENLHLVRCILDEAFGSENVVAIVSVVKTSAQEDLLLPAVCDYVLWYAKDRSRVKFRQLWLVKKTQDAGASDYNRLALPDLTRRRMSPDEEQDWTHLPKHSRIYTQDNIVSQRPPGDFPVPFEGEVYRPITGYWKTGEAGMKRLLNASRVERRGSMLRYVRFYADFPVRPIANFWPDVRFSSRIEDKVYVVQTAARMIERCTLMATDPGELVLDPTCGSGTTAYVAEQWGRRWITCDTSRVALALARTRLMAARFPYYLLADTPEGQKREAELAGKVPPAIKTDGDIKRGFIYQRVAHIALKSIANNEEIDAIHADFAPKLQTALAAVNTAAKQTRQEWEVPRELPQDSQSSLRAPHSEFWRLRRERQEAIDASIARRADTEQLFDQPYEDPKRIRVAGPFTVESLSPHRVLSADENQDGTVTEQEGRKHQNFVAMILDNLSKAGVQNTRKTERLTFDRLEPFPGIWLHARGEYTDKDGKTRRAAVCIGPEHGTVGPDLVKEAAKEAVQGVGFDLLIVCGFAFDPHVSEETKHYGKLAVIPARMNPDLAMGDELLKKTGAGNLFMVFGEPDMEIKPRKNGKITVQIKGVDIYDPTTGQIRNSSTDDIACWFIDTDYNGESFFVRHAYFTGADEPYEKLKRALRAEIDEAAWQTLYSTTSRPLARPKTRKIAIKVINHYGDEVLKVYEVAMAPGSHASALTLDGTAQ